MTIGDALYRCSFCLESKPLTDEHWYFRKTGRYAGHVTGWCKPCHTLYYRHYEAELAPADLARRRLRQLAWERRTRGVDPARYRRSKYEAAS